MPLPSWRDELGQANGSGFNLMEMYSYFSQAGPILDIRSHAIDFEKEFDAKVHEAAKRVKAAAADAPRTEGGAFDGDAPSFAILEAALEMKTDLAQRVRILRNGLFLGAYGHFEYIVIGAATAKLGNSTKKIRKCTNSIGGATS